LARSHGRRLWDQAADGLVEVRFGTQKGWLLAEDAEPLSSPLPAQGLRLIPPGDPFLQKPNRALLAPDPGLRKRLFRPVASPGAVLKDGRLAGLWRVRAGRGKAELTVERLGRLSRGELAEEARRIAQLRGEAEAVVSFA
jgi:hypothetical protein